MLLNINTICQPSGHLFGLLPNCKSLGGGLRTLDTLQFLYRICVHSWNNGSISKALDRSVFERFHNQWQDKKLESGHPSNLPHSSFELHELNYNGPLRLSLFFLGALPAIIYIFRTTSSVIIRTDAASLFLSFLIFEVIILPRHQRWNIQSFSSRHCCFSCASEDGFENQASGKSSTPGHIDELTPEQQGLW